QVSQALITLCAVSGAQEVTSIAEAADTPVKKTRVILSFLEAIDLAAQDSEARFVPAGTQAPTVAQLEEATQSYKEKQDSDRGRLELMLRYAESTLCRTRLLLNYFEYEDAGGTYRCGHCDNCDRDAASDLRVASIKAGPELARLRQ